MRADRLIVAVCALALAACAADPPRKTARKPAAAKTAQTSPARTRPAPAPAQSGPATTPATPPASTTATPPPSRPTDAAPRQVDAPPPATPVESAAAGPATPQARYAEALELLKTGQLQAAEAALRRATQEFPQRTGPQTNLGIVLARLDRKNEAAAAFARAIALDPDNAIAHNWLGVLARERGDHARAEQAYRQALVADARHAPAQLNLAILYDLYLKRPTDAIAAYRRYEELTGKSDARAAVWIAELQAKMAGTPPATPQAMPVGAPKPAAPRRTGADS